MFKLIKLGMYALLGYVLYELYQGMTQESGSYGRSGGNLGGGFGGGGSGALTGPGEGMTETASDYGGGEMRHTVGRGVVR